MKRSALQARFTNITYNKENMDKKKQQVSILITELLNASPKIYLDVHSKIAKRDTFHKNINMSKYNLIIAIKQMECPPPKPC